MSEQGQSIAFRWALDVAHAERLRPRVDELAEGVTSERVPAGHEADPDLPLLLEASGIRLAARGAVTPEEQLVLSGQTTPEGLARLVVQYAGDDRSAGLVVDVCERPIRLTEVPEISSSTVIIVDDAGGRVLEPNPAAITGALLEACSA